MSKERNNYEMPTNEDFEDLLQENLKVTKPLEMKEKEVGGMKQLFPFWNPVEPEGVHYSPDSYLSAKQKKEREMKGEKNMVQKMEDIIGKINNTQMVDMTDAVKPPKNEMSGTSTNKQVTSWDSTSEQPLDMKSHAAKPSADNVGAVKPKEEGMKDTSTDKKMTSWDSTSEQPLDTKSHAANPPADNVDAVKPKEEGMKDTATSDKVTSSNTTEEVKEVSNAANPPADNVGAVKPKEEDMKSTSTDKKMTEWDSTNPVKEVSHASKSYPYNGREYGGIDFSKFM